MIHEDKLLKSRTRCPTMWAMVNVDNHLGFHWTPLCRMRVNWEQVTRPNRPLSTENNLRYVSHNLDPSFGFREKWSFWDSSSDYQNLLFKTKEESTWKKSFPVGFIIFLKHISLTSQFIAGNENSLWGLYLQWSIVTLCSLIVSAKARNNNKYPTDKETGLVHSYQWSSV